MVAIPAFDSDVVVDPVEGVEVVVVDDRIVAPGYEIDVAAEHVEPCARGAGEEASLQRLGVRRPRVLDRSTRSGRVAASRRATTVPSECAPITAGPVTSSAASAVATAAACSSGP